MQFLSVPFLSSFRHALALRLHRYGFYVYAGCLLPDQAGANELRERGAGDGRLRVVPCDVTNTAQVSECAAKIREELQKLKIGTFFFWEGGGERFFFPIYDM